MQKFRLFCLLFLNILLHKNVQANTSLESRVESLIQHHLPNATIGIILQNPNTGDIIYQRRAQENFYPASNTKLFSAAAALKHLGPDFEFQTSLHAHPDKIQNGILRDHLYLVFRGDPTFTVGALQRLFASLEQLGIRQIDGDIIIDDSAFKAPWHAPGWTWDSINLAYSAPVTAAIFNENKIRVKLQPGKVHEAVLVEQADKRLPPFKVISDIYGVPATEAAYKCSLQTRIHDNQLHFTGCWVGNNQPAWLELSFDNPSLLAKSLVERSLKQLNIVHQGQVRVGPNVPDNIPAISSKHSPPLSFLLKNILSHSNNLYTETLLKALGNSYYHSGTFQSGIQALHAVLGSFGLGRDHFKIFDGSGQSRYNLISPAVTAKLLTKMYRDPNFPIFYNALSVSGKRGTLAGRLSHPSLQGKVVAKTGTARGMSALSGYLTTHQGNPYVFSIMINQATKRTRYLKALENQLCQLFISAPWEAKSATQSWEPHQIAKKTQVSKKSKVIKSKTVVKKPKQRVRKKSSKKR